MSPTRLPLRHSAIEVMFVQIHNLFWMMFEHDSKLMLAFGRVKSHGLDHARGPPAARLLL